MFRYAVTIFVSAFLLFQVQPLIGRFILPWFGGGPSIWTSCMLFFQILLLGGYLYAHLISVLLKPRTQVITHLSLLTVSLVFLPIAPSDSWKPVADDSPLLQILLLLLATVGGPYFLLSSTGPMMQKWFSQTSPNQSPWRLYALSNIGSLLALLSYPFAFEPWLALRQQVWSWSIVYAAYVGLAAWCGVRYLRHESHPATKFQPGDVSNGTFTSPGSMADAARAARPGVGIMLLWLGLAACSSAMLLATTNQLCIDVATVPFLWVLPLSLYLISFIICFDSPQWYDRRAYGLLLIACCPMACWILNEGADVNISKQVVIYATILFTCCMTCHGELVSCKPHSQYLTLFYVLISAGGALGGVFVAIVAPYTFHGYWEYHIGLVACCAITLIAWCVQRIWLRPPSPAFWIWAVVVAGQIAFVTYFVALPVVETVDAKDQTIAIGAYVLFQMLGLLVTGMVERSTWRLSAAWVVSSIIPSAWLCTFGAWKYPALMGRPVYFSLIAVAVASSALAIGLYLLVKQFHRSYLRLASVGIVCLVAGSACGWLLWDDYATPHLVFEPTSRKLLQTLLAAAAILPLMIPARLWWKGISDTQTTKLSLIIAFYAISTGTSSVLLHFKWIEAWHCVSFATITGAAALMEWSAMGFQRLRPSLGFWFWVPAVTLVMLLSNRLAVIVTTDGTADRSERTVYTSRNFYGVLRVEEEGIYDEEDQSFVALKYALTHGQIKHGFQFTDEYWKTQPTTYYGRESGVGIAIQMSRDRQLENGRHGLRVGVVGLGTGTIAAYGEKGDTFRFYDINPDVIALSDKYFTYLSDSSAETKVVPGDARIMMEREIATGQSQQFDVLAIDAFSSDAIPVHLLTSECGEIYRQQLRPGGILAVHISNRFLDLNPVTRGLAKHLGWNAYRIENSGDSLSGVFSSTWILLTSDEELGKDATFQDSLTPWKDSEGALHWTDDYSGLWQVLSL